MKKTVEEEEIMHIRLTLSRQHFCKNLPVSENKIRGGLLNCCPVIGFTKEGRTIMTVRRGVFALDITVTAPKR